MHRFGRAVDLHSHWWPREFVAAVKAGRRWHAWDSDLTGRVPRIVAGDRDTTAPVDLFVTDPVERRERRAANEGIVREAAMVPVYLWGYELAPAEAEAYCRDVNADLADAQRSGEDSFTGLGLLPLQDADAALRVLDHAIKDLGLYAFSIGTNVEDANLDDPAVVAVLDQVLAAGAAIVMHANWYTRAGRERTTRHMFDNSIGVPLECGLALASLIYSGLLDRYPNARICSTHGGGWLPYGIGRLNLRYLQGRDGQALPQAPDRYLRRFYYDCLVHDERSLQLLVQRVGADRVVIGTDHPYGGDIPEVGAVRWIADQPFLTSREKDMIVRENAADFLDGARAAVRSA
jgi:aminocarboxymuconate-semialdehyde decarboxylase